MPSLAAHFACVTIVQDRLDIKNKHDFFCGTLYPDLVSNSHFKTKSNNGIFMVPLVSDYLQRVKYNLNDFEKGYLVHLLLDKYYLEKFAYKFGLEPFLNGRIYEDYSLISTRLLNDFNVDKIAVSDAITSFEQEIDKNKLDKMTKFLKLEDLHQDTSIINYEELKQFIKKISNIIIDDIKQYKKMVK